jgi:hypothetical protein
MNGGDWDRGGGANTGEAEHAFAVVLWTNVCGRTTQVQSNHLECISDQGYIFYLLARSHTHIEESEHGCKA